MKHCFFCCLYAWTLLLPSCTFLPAFTQEEYGRRRHDEMERQYAPYRQRNTIEGYREFIARYPDNAHLETALDQIDNLEFAPYEKAGTIAAYGEFVARYPRNRHAVTARSRIDQATIRDCERIDTIAAYRRFLEQHPGNIFAQTAQDRLQELEFRQLAETMQRRCGFDLLLFRLHVRRLQKQLPEIAGVGLGDFTLFASLEQVQGRQYFTSHLIYNDDLAAFGRASAAERGMIFSALIAPLIGCLARQPNAPQSIGGFSFALARSRDRFYGNEKAALEYAFPAGDALLFGRGGCTGTQLLARCAVRQTQPVDNAPKAVSAEPIGVSLEGTDIIKQSAARRHTNDCIMTADWKRVNKDGTVHSVKMERKWKNFNGAGGYGSKSVINYLHSRRSLYADAILTAADTAGRRQYWYIYSKGDAGRTPDIDNYRPPAERDFPLSEFIEAPEGSERHQYAGSASAGSSQCFLVHSTPVSATVPYAKRTSFIDRHSLLPVKIEYFDTSGALWKTARFKWQKAGGVWFWLTVVVENAQSGDVTTITVTDVKPNPGLPYRDFTPGMLSRH